MIGPAIYIGVMLLVWKVTAVAPIFADGSPLSGNLNSAGKYARSTSSIPGPKSLDDKIAIVGAGPAGIHMAYKLKKAGFRKVTVFERTDEIGGKSKTVYHRFTPHEMGTCYTQADYSEIYRLIEELDAGDLLSMPGPILWLDLGNTTVPLSRIQYVGLTAAQLNPEMNETEIQSYLQAAVVKYIGLHISLFGSYPGMLMPRPSDAVFAATNMTFLEFLKGHDIEILTTVFIPALTVQGYGQLDEVSALYGLLWMTPNFLTQLIRPRPSGETSVKILSKGYQTLWQEMAKQADINVRLSSPVIKIRPTKTGFKLTYRTCRRRRQEIFDFLMLTPHMRSLCNIINFNSYETELFTDTVNQFMTTTLVDTTYGEPRALGPQNYHLSNVLSKSDTMVWGQRDSYASLNFIVGDNYTSGEFPSGPDGKNLQTSVYYQVSKSMPDPRSLKRDVRRHIVSVENAEVVKMQDQIIWPYFPRYSVSDMASGVLWDIMDMQGQYGKWYLGSSVSFESVANVVDYNDMLFKNYDLPTDM